MSGVINKEKLMVKMAKNLVALRNKFQLKQYALADKEGTSSVA